MTRAVTIRSRPSRHSAHGCNVGMLAGTTAATVTLAEAVPPVPPSTEVTAPVVLFFVPAVVPVTFTLKVHEALAASVAPVKLTAPDPAVATMVPPPQLPASPFGDDSERGNPPDPVDVTFREPQVAIGAGRDAERERAGGDAGAELGDHLGLRGAAAQPEQGEPQADRTNP